mmetsp:Transcript_60092/g.186443  ORF Transcript_60092/g.186443 Transcript_60092/m.186443 type:complete len:267 (+) Transcript_60092:384-1184(+)
MVTLQAKWSDDFLCCNKYHPWESEAGFYVEVVSRGERSEGNGYEWLITKTKSDPRVEKALGLLRPTIEAADEHACQQGFEPRPSSAPRPAQSEVASGGYCFLRLDLDGRSLYLAETPQTGGYPEAALSSDPSKRTRLQITKLDTAGKKVAGTPAIQRGDTVCLRCLLTLDRPDYVYLYGSSGGWAKYCAFSDSEKKLRWTIVTPGTAGPLLSGDKVELKDNYYLDFLCGNLDKTWEDEQGYYIEVVSKSKRAGNKNASYTWAIELA